MNKPEINETVRILLKRIRELPEGTETSTAKLIWGIFNNPRDLQGSFLDIHFALLDAAKQEGIYLDMSGHEGKDEGLPYNLEFVILRASVRSGNHFGTRFEYNEA